MVYSCIWLACAAFNTELKQTYIRTLNERKIEAFIKCNEQLQKSARLRFHGKGSEPQFICYSKICYGETCYANLAADFCGKLRDDDNAFPIQIAQLAKR